MTVNQQQGEKRRSDWRGPRDHFSVRLPADVSSKLRADAAARGVTLSDYFSAIAALATLGSTTNPDTARKAS